MILSIDVGIRNLAMCLYDDSTTEIVEWDVSGVPPEVAPVCTRAFASTWTARVGASRRYDLD